MKKIFLFQFLVLLLCLLLTTSEQAQNSTNSTSPIINVHLICHTHDDVGWLETVDAYYTSEVQYILDTVVQQLSADPNKKFIYVEIAFFYRWWNEQNDDKKALVRQLVKNGQLEFINGGWCMNDEADAYYEDIVDQMTLGLMFLKKEFNFVPTIGWQIDPFGHSNTMASIFSQLGFNAEFFARVDYQDKEVRLAQQKLEMVWNPPQASNAENSILASINYQHYSAPPTFCFDFRCDPSSNPDVEQDQDLETYNIEVRANTFAEYFKAEAQNFLHNTEIMMTMGDDFNYQGAQRYFKNIDNLVNHINNRSEEYGIRLLYSTPSIYIDTINKMNVTFPEKTDDFFPYADQIDAYWTGYFTSRVAFKYNVKLHGRYLQSVRTLFSLLRMNNQYLSLQPSFLSALATFEDAMGTGQHHDAVTGTEQQHVVEDYTFRITNGRNQMNAVVHELVSQVNQELIQETNTYFEQCNWNLTSSDCNITYTQLSQNSTILLTVYNPTVARNYILRVKVPHSYLKVIDTDNNELVSDVFCPNITDSSDCDLYAYVSFDAFSVHYYKVVPIESNENYVVPQDTVTFFGDSIQQISKNQYLSVQKDFQTYEYKYCNGEEGQDSCKINAFSIYYNYYKSFQSVDQQNSGAYIFRPDSETFNQSIPYSIPDKSQIFVGKLLTILATYSPNITSYVKFYNSEYENFVPQTSGQNYVEIETFVNSIDISDNQGKEITINIQDFNIHNNNTFYTDSNGLEKLQRINNYRPTWNLSVNQPVSGNYYPVQAFIQIQDTTSGKNLYLINDRAQGGTSHLDGQVELMIHRRLVDDDSRGVGEPLNETNPWNSQGMIAVLQHFLIFADSDADENVQRKFQYHQDLFPIIVFGLTDSSDFLSSPQVNERQVGGQLAIPELLKIYVNPLDWQEQNDQYLVRLHNMNEFESITVSFPFDGYQELALGANQLKSEMQASKLKWNYFNAQNATIQTETTPSDDVDNNMVTVKPLEIRTFLVESRFLKKLLKK